MMHPKSHKGPLMVPLDACQPLRLLDATPEQRLEGTISMPESHPIKAWVEAGTAQGTWEDTGAWDGILGVRDLSFISPPRVTKGQSSFSVMWGLAFEQDRRRHKLVYLCVQSRI
uniref:Uncharacterized protein n=1 Tax=Hemiselmis andersenii TaxID=464988 RepID=A0A7S0Y085_HEMAN